MATAEAALTHATNTAREALDAWTRDMGRWPAGPAVDAPDVRVPVRSREIASAPAQHLYGQRAFARST